MSALIDISIIIPVYNAEKYIKNCIESLLTQDFKGTFEIILVDDASTDNTKNEIEKYNIPFLKFFPLKVNAGQSAARNLGIKKAKGIFFYFMDIDDTIEKSSLSTLHNLAINKDCDLVFSDFKRFESGKNQRNNIFNYSEDKFFDSKELLNSMQNELYDHNPLFGHLGLFGCNARLIKSSVIHENKIIFEEDLRMMEDKAFGWDILGFVKNAYYVKKQLYSYHVHPNVSTAVVDGVNNGFPLANFELVKNHIQNGLRSKGLNESNVEKCGDQGFIFFIITLLVSYTRCMFLKKVDFNIGNKHRKKIIKKIINDPYISKAIKNYHPSKQESYWIPKSIALKSCFFLELACNHRAKKVLQMRRDNKS
jgi:glycosyltransferase involved in cell wall biosynthesis